MMNGQPRWSNDVMISCVFSPLHLYGASLVDGVDGQSQTPIEQLPTLVGDRCQTRNQETGTQMNFSAIGLEPSKGLVYTARISNRDRPVPRTRSSRGPIFVSK